MSGVSSKEIVHVVVGVSRKKKLKQYCLDHDVKMTEFFCQVIDDLPPDYRQVNDDLDYQRFKALVKGKQQVLDSIIPHFEDKFKMEGESK